MNLSRRGIDFIIEQEATGEKYYTKRESRPNWPGESSGVTIGIGWDIGQNTAEALRQEWGQELWESHLERLEAVAGITGPKAEKYCEELNDIDIPWASAIRVFKKFTIPRYWALTLKAYPQAETIHPDAASALVSLVFNRGASLKGDRRIEMRAIQSALADNRLEAIPQLFKDQTRLWPDTEGLRNRRIAEANLFQSTLTA